MRSRIAFYCALAALAIVCMPTDIVGAGGTGSLYVKSSPAGGRIFLDEIETKWKTPRLIPSLAEGTYTVTVKLDGYYDAKSKVDVKPGTLNKITLTLTKSGGAPGAKPKSGTVAATIDVECPYCTGKGVITHIGCFRCCRTGNAGLNQCPACSGAGLCDTTCKKCEGSGSVMVGGRETECRRCSGKIHPKCMGCRGKGTIKRANPDASRRPTKQCASCSGSGYSTNVPCKFCEGQGSVKACPGFATVRAVFRSKKITCPLCKGARKGPPICTRCEGKGAVNNTGGMCGSCCGSGHMYVPCRSCRGKGFIAR